MDKQIALLAEAAKRSTSTIAELVYFVMAEADESARDAAFGEVQETILSLIAATIAADSFTAYEEFVFASLVAKDLRDPLRCRAYLDEYAARWKNIAGKTPDFFLAVLRYDIRNQTLLSRDIMCELRKIAQYAASVDGEATDSETRVGNELVDHIERLFRQARWTVKWDDHSAPSIPDSAIRRDEFHAREIIGRPPDSRIIE